MKRLILECEFVKTVKLPTETRTANGVVRRLITMPEKFAGREVLIIVEKEAA